jgi:hypothetical protein
MERRSLQDILVPVAVRPGVFRAEAKASPAPAALLNTLTNMGRMFYGWTGIAVLASRDGAGPPDFWPPPDDQPEGLLF